MNGTADQLLDRLCKHLANEKSYSVLGVADGDTLVPYGVGRDEEYPWVAIDIPELIPLTEYFSRIMVRSDGYAFEVVCIKNRLGVDADAVSISVDQLRSIGRECLIHTGKIQGSKMPVSIKVWEITDSLNDAVGHLRDLRCMPGLKKVGITSWSLNVDTGNVWSNARFNGRFSGRKFVEKILSMAADGVTPDPDKAVQIGTDIRYPVLTYGLIVVMGALYALQLMYGQTDGMLSPAITSLVASGGLYYPSVFNDGEWYRLIAAGFLHAGLLHLLFNTIALYLSGVLLEKWLGRAWLFTIFALSLLGGSVASLLINTENIVSVGASGAIMGMLATAFMVALRLPYGQERTSSMMNLMYFLIPALLPLASVSSDGTVDYAAHFGGAVTGFIIGFVLLKTWVDGERLPRFATPAVFFAALSVVVISISMAQAFSNRPKLEAQYALATHVAANELFDGLELYTDEGSARLDKLQIDYPRDPRTQYFAALFDYGKEKTGDAESHLRLGLSEEDILQRFFDNGKLEIAMRILLVDILYARQAKTEASQILKPVCVQLTAGDVNKLDSAWVRGVCGATLFSGESSVLLK